MLYIVKKTSADSIREKAISMCSKQGGELLSVLVNKLKRKNYDESAVYGIVNSMSELKKSIETSRGKESIRYELNSL